MTAQEYCSVQICAASGFKPTKTTNNNSDVLAAISDEVREVGMKRPISFYRANT